MTASFQTSGLCRGKKRMYFLLRSPYNKY